MSPTRVATLLAAALAGAGCSLQETIDEMMPQPKFETARKLPPLSVPPGLSDKQIADQYQVPDGGHSARAWEQGNRAGTGAGDEVLPIQNDVRVERNGDKRWLVVNARPAQVWPKVRDFWTENGFLLNVEDPTIGILETDWAENRADIPKGVVERLISKISDRVYSAATRDKFRTRLERGAQPDTTEVYVSHRGAQEISDVQNSDTSKLGGEAANYKWAPRPADPELEAFMLNRMMQYFGVSAQVASERIADTGEAPPRAHLVEDDTGAMILALREDFSRAWQRTGLALDRIGFTVEDRDRSKGLYFVRYVDPATEGIEDDSFLGKLKFWDDDEKPKDTEYLISLASTENVTQVSVLDKTTQRSRTKTAVRILSLLHDELK